MQACRGCPVMGAAMSGSHGRMLERARRVGAPCKPCWATPEVTAGGFIGQFGDARASRGWCQVVSPAELIVKSCQQHFSRTDYSLLQAERPRSCRSFDSAARSRAAFSSRSSRSIWLSSIPSSSSCSKLHPKLNSPFLSDAFCDQFHPWRREANLKCVVSIDTSSLHDKFCAS